MTTDQVTLFLVQMMMALFGLNLLLNYVAATPGGSGASKAASTINASKWAAQQFPLSVEFQLGARIVDNWDPCCGDLYYPPDAYCKIFYSLDGFLKKKPGFTPTDNGTTEAISDVRNPDWQHWFKFPAPKTPQSNETLFFEIWDEDLAGPDDLIGNASIPLTRLITIPSANGTKSVVDPIELPIVDDRGKQNGVLVIRNRKVNWRTNPPKR